MRAIVAKPRGFCAGVERAIRVVELALQEHGPPIYVRKEIVHNLHVVERLRAQGAVFVHELDEVPGGAVTVLSAHGSPPHVYENARRLNLRLIDATCPLVTKVHREVRRYARQGYRIILRGHAGHDEVVGTMGQVPEQTTLIKEPADIEQLRLQPGERGIILTQTTLSQDDTREITAALRRRFPQLEEPPTEDICYATQNRQNAVKRFCEEIDLLLVVGSRNSSNSCRLAEVGRARGVESHLIDRPDDIQAAWLEGKECIGVTSGASAPEDIVQAVLQWLRAAGVQEIEEIDAPDEQVVFTLPKFVSGTSPPALDTARPDNQ
jgi:4-hydroxy-3-methylbut-2-enyl diphosphate reductase